MASQIHYSINFPWKRTAQEKMRKIKDNKPLHVYDAYDEQFSRRERNHVRFQI